MDMIYHIETKFSSVLLLNGSFLESANSVDYPAELPLYVTVLPLSAMLLPYTVKLGGGKILSNSEFAVSYNLGKNHYYVKLARRYNIVYSPSAPAKQPENDIVYRFFDFVTSGMLEKARSLLSPSLDSAVDNSTISDFFASATDIAKNNFVPPQENTYFVLTPSSATLFLFELDSSGLIQNIDEVAPN